jgi:hypothetical protein
VILNHLDETIQLKISEIIPILHQVLIKNIKFDMLFCKRTSDINKNAKKASIDLP